jgi:tRNA A37 threonylcarbamoyladenosine dehydratase
MKDAAGKNMSRQDRLAAKLRENLRRRKAQARAMGDSAMRDPERVQTLSNPPSES